MRRRSYKTNIAAHIGFGFIKKIEDNKFVKSIKSDVQKSESLKFIKDKAKEAADKTNGVSLYQKKQMRTAIAIITVFVLLVVVTIHIHKCEECDKIYLKNKNAINFGAKQKTYVKIAIKIFIVGICNLGVSMKK